MKKIHGVYLSVALITLVTVIGCAGNHFRSTRGPADENFEQMKGNYDKLHPLYAIECASSEFDQKGETPGGKYGHTFMYLKGACRDKTAPYPKIKICGEGTDLTNPESGVGLALDKSFQNTRYMASDGFNFLINGDLSPNSPLDTDAFESAVRKVIADGDTKGIILNQAALNDKKNPQVNKGDPNMSDEEWTAREVIGSGFAVDFARNLGCVAVPINPKMLAAAVDYVNNQNVPFVTGKKKFVWDHVSDQCVQFSHNIFAAMGIGEPIKTSSGRNWLMKKALSAWDFTTYLTPFVRSRMPAPVNELDKTDQETDGAKIYNLQEAYKNKTVRTNFEKFGGIVATDGVLIWTHDAHTTDNQYFNVDHPLTPADLPVIHPVSRTFRKLTEMPTATMVADNLAAYQARLQATISSMDIEGRGIDSSEYCDFAAVQNKTPNSNDFKKFCADYTAYLLQTKTDVANRMVKLNGL